MSYTGLAFANVMQSTAPCSRILPLTLGENAGKVFLPHGKHFSDCQTQSIHFSNLDVMHNLNLKYIDKRVTIDKDIWFFSEELGIY